MFNKLEAVILTVLSQLKADVQDYCDLETVDGGQAIVANDGSLASIVRFNGTKSVLGREQFERLVSLLEASLSVYFKVRGHHLQIVFSRDLDATAPLEQNALQQAATAERLNLNVRHLINEGVSKYAQYVYDEECYLVFWSRPALLDQTERAMAREALNEFRAQSQWPATADAQNLLRPISYLKDRHLSFVTKITEDLTSPEFGCSADVLDVSEAIRAIRAKVNPDITPRTWKPYIPGSAIPMRWKTSTREDDVSEFMYPTLPSQIMVTSGEIGNGQRTGLLPDPTSVRVGARVYAPLIMSIPPAEPQYFNTLFNSLNRAETQENGVSRALPYSVSVMLSSDGMSVLAWKSLFAQLLSITSEQNRNINLATKELRERVRDGECMVKLQVAAMTWSSPDERGVKELALRKSKLWRTLEAWGQPVFIERTGNPMQAFQSNCLGLTTKHLGTPAAAPLGDAVAMLPLTRPASPFQEGSTIYRSLDGKILKYQRFSSQQTTWITLIAGKPGSGKSVLMNNNHFESCLMPGLTGLPYIGITDIGISSSGFCDLVRDNLPPRLHHLVVYKRLQNARKDCINPLDTPLGQRYPLPKDREFNKNFLTILVTPPEREKPYEGMSNFVGRMVDLAYRRKDDKIERASPETYKPGHNDVVDTAVAQLGFRILPATTYWELVDAMFDAGMVYEAEVTQRYAVPTLNDLVAVASTEEVRAEYEGSGEVGRSLVDAFILGIREAVGDFPVFADHTRFDVGSARIVALDLQDVALQGSSSAKKQTALMYMIARQCFMKKVAFSKEDFPFFTEKYLPFYERLVADLVDEYKVMCMDEFHKTGGHVGLQEQMQTDGREARKWNMEIILASQLMEDFGSLTKIATATFILDSGTKETRDWLRKNIGLSDTEEHALVNFVHGANKHGCTFLARFETKNATYSQLFTMSAGPMRLWALTTTAEDRKLRTMLYEHMPRPDALALLARRFPSGGCKDMVERLKRETFKDVEFVDDDMEQSVIARIAKDLVADYIGASAFEDVV